MTSRTLQRFLVVILLVGTLIAPMVLPARATVPRLQDAGPVVIDFEDLGTKPGMLTVVSDQYADLGVTFNNPEVRNFAADSDDEPAFAHSGSLAAQHCFSEEFCNTPLIMTFSEPQRRVKVWVGLDSSLDKAMQVTMTAFDAETGGAEVASTPATLGPSGGQDIPVQTPLEVTDPDGAIRRVVIGFSSSLVDPPALVFDDVEFEPAPGQVDCPDGTPAPEVALNLPTDDGEVQIEDFTLQGRVDTSSPLTQATLTVANQDRNVPVNVLSLLPQEGGEIGPIVVDNALQPGQNTVSLTVGNCAGANASIEYSPIDPDTRYKLLGLEVTQTIQDLTNSVPLIADKRTFVRVYLRTIRGTEEIYPVSGQLRGCVYADENTDDVETDDLSTDDVPTDDVPMDDVQFPVQQECFGSSSELRPLEPLDPIIVYDTDDIYTQRVNLKMPVSNKKTTDADEGEIAVVMNYGLLFELPPNWIQAGHLRLQFDGDSLSPGLPCDDCDAITDVTFISAQPVDLNLVDTWYDLGDKRYEPRDIDHQRIESWLERAYPTDMVTVSSLTEVRLDAPPADCYEVKTLLFEVESPAMIASPSAPPNPFARYYGLVAFPSPDQVKGCSTTSKESDPIDRYAVGPAGTGAPYTWDIDGSYADFYAGHELGHTYLQRHPGVCKDEGPVNTEMPPAWQTGFITDTEHKFVGFDPGAYRDENDVPWRTTYPGFPWRDMMTYCEERWISAYTYAYLSDRMNNETDASLARMAAPAPGQEVLLVSGIIDLTSGSFIRRPLSRLPGDLVSPRPAASTYTINLIDTDSSGRVLRDTPYPFNPREFTDQPPPPAPQFAQVAEVVPWVDPTDIIEIRSGTTVLDTIAVSDPPTVTLFSPNGGEQLTGGDFHVTWDSSDPNDDKLTHTLLYSTDDGVTWQTAAGNIADKEYWVDTDRLPGSNTARFRVIVTDGVNTAQDDSDASFTVADKAPTVNIVSPVDGETFTSANTIVLTGAATDIELGELDGPAMLWESNLQGRLGEGRSIGTILTPGVHTITLTATDGKTPAVSTSISITITDANPPHLVWPDPLPASQLREGQFFYDAEEELGAFYTTDGAGGIQQVRSFDVLLNGWTAIVPGDFGGDESTDLLFYASQGGVGEFFAGDGNGGLQLLSGNEGFTRGWDLIVPGNFDDDAEGWTDLFFYNAEEGEGKFYSTDGAGRIRLLGEPGTFHNGWTSIVAGEFGGDDHTDLLFYDKATGLAQLFTTDGLGGLEVLDDDVDWIAGWDQIVSGNFGGGDGLTDLFLFDAETGNATFLSGDSTGQFVPLGDVEPFSTRWTSIMSGDFGGDKRVTDLFFYDAEQGMGRYYLTDGQGGIKQLSSSDDFPKGWDQIVPGYFERS